MNNLIENLNIIIISSCLFGYVLGSIPFGLIVTNLYGLEDIRKIGSRNIGATNVLRTGKKGLAFITLILDFLKGYLSILITKIFLNQLIFKNIEDIQEYKLLLVALAGFFSVIGHTFPVWLNFKGGKGVATGLGVVISFDPLIGVITLSIWIIIFCIFKISSLSSLISFAISPLLFLVNKNENIIIYVCITITLIIFVKHKENIARLIKKEETIFKK